MIAIEPRGGLANRMRVVDSALSLGRNLDRQVKIIWPLVRGLCGCPFQELFVLPEFASLDEKTESKIHQCQYLPNNILFMCKWLNKWLRYDHVIFQTELRKLKDSKFDFESLQKYSSVYIACCDRFYYKQKYQYLVPNEHVRQRISDLTSQFPPLVIGVHIRRNDHKKAIQNNPTSWFIKLMKEEIEKDDSVVFFLATDSPEEEQDMKKLFGDRIITFAKKLDRNNPEAIQDALVDLLCLSKTRKIIGSFYSSFSDIAADIGYIEFVARHKA